MSQEHEKGATAILVAMTMILLLGIAAVALDLAAGWNERRQDQIASDLAAVSGALSTGDEDAMVDEAMATARANLDTQYSNGDWNALWTSCVDSERPPGFTPLTHSSLGPIDCISVSPDYFRVRLPDQTIETRFGSFVGFDTLTVHADTIVTLPSEGVSGALPFAVRANASAGEICLDTSTGSKIVPPCDGNESGSFGNIAPPLFGNTDLGTSPECKHQTSNNNHVAESIAMGIDHGLSKFSSDDWSTTGWSPSDNTSNNSVDSVANMDECTDTGGQVAEYADGSPIDAVYVDTGNSVKKAITEGLVTGTGYQDGSDARLTRSGDRRKVDGYWLDNQPLWQHLLDDSAKGELGTVDYDDGGTWAPESCDPQGFKGQSLSYKNAQMTTCLDDYQAGSYSGQIFDDSLTSSPRLGTAPRLWHDNLGSGISYRPIKRFDVVYVHALHFDDKDETAFYPDDASSGDLNMKKWKDVEQVTAFLLVDDMVSPTVKKALEVDSTGLIEPTIFE